MKKILFIISLITISISSYLYAETPFKFAVLEDLSYDDNIYLSSNNNKSSIISSTQLFAEYLNSIPNSGLKFGANANLGYNIYSENSSKNNYMNAGLGLNLSNKIFVLSDSFLYTTDPSTSELTDRAKRINNIATFKVKTSLEKMFSIGFLVSDILDRYIDDEYSAMNRNRVNAGTQLYYNVSSKTSFYLGYLFSKINYEDYALKNSLGNSISLGVNGHLSSKIKGTAQISYDMRNYEEDLENAENNIGIFGYLLSLSYEPTAKDFVSLTGERKMEEATFANNRYYISTEIGAEYKHKINKKWAANILLSYENIGYPETVDDVNRTDNLVKVKPSVEYKFKDNLFANVWYQLKNKSSNYDNAEYTSNKFGINVKYCF